MGIYHTTESSHHFEEILKYKEINFDITIFLTNIGNWIVGTLVGIVMGSGVKSRVRVGFGCWTSGPLRVSGFFGF